MEFYATPTANQCAKKVMQCSLAKLNPHPWLHTGVNRLNKQDSAVSEK